MSEESVSAKGESSSGGLGPLPEQVRHRLITLASQVLGKLSGDEVPASLRPFARFAPARRARLAATPLATALDGDAGFRARVAEQIRQQSPDLAEALRAESPPPAADPSELAAAAYLLRTPDWEQVVQAASSDLERDAAAQAADRDAGTIAKLHEQLSEARAAVRQTRERYRDELTAVKQENQNLRHTLRETRDRVREAEQRAERAHADLAEQKERADRDAARADSEVRRLRARLSEAEAATEAARRASREGRDHTSVRLRLLVDTLVEATQGIRRELALPVVDQSDHHPADLVEAVEPGAAGAAAHGRDDPAYAANLLALPQLHLVVDGYNVTKAAWSRLSLENQRSRLVSALADLAARTGAEVTCVFDGADLEVPPPVSTPRSVRVRFSPAGVTADEVIRRIVAAEPSGRPVAVVSSDREVSDGVRRSGAHPIGAEAFLRQLGR